MLLTRAKIGLAQVDVWYRPVADSPLSAILAVALFVLGCFLIAVSISRARERGISPVGQMRRAVLLMLATTLAVSFAVSPMTLAFILGWPMILAPIVLSCGLMALAVIEQKRAASASQDSPREDRKQEHGASGEPS
jgi:CHASE2 domain-containing sensor protein